MPEPTFWPGVATNWGRWGPADERGTLNLLTPDRVLAAAATVRQGRVLSLGRPLDADALAYYPDAMPAAFVHEMVTAWSSNAGGDVQAASDQVHVQCHGLDTTHMDALCHIGHRGVGYGGRDLKQMVDERGARIGDIASVGPVVTRAVLVDIPRLRGLGHLDHGTPVTEEDLCAAAPDLRPGDAVLVRTGRWLAGDDGRGPQEKYGRLSGLHPDAMRVIAGLDPAVLGTDGAADTFPVPVDECRLPIHVLALVYLGIHLLHSLDLEALATTLAAEQRSDFMLVVAPLPIPGGTGSPVAPVAVL